MAEGRGVGGERLGRKMEENGKERKEKEKRSGWGGTSAWVHSSHWQPVFWCGPPAEPPVLASWPLNQAYEYRSGAMSAKKEDMC